jgi:hypothetical protein
MPLSNVFSNTGFCVWPDVSLQVFWEKRLMNCGGAEAASSANDHVAVLVVPLDCGSRTQPKFLAHFGGNGYLSLRGNLGFSDRHAFHITAVMARLSRYALSSTRRPNVLGLKSDFALVPDREHAYFIGRDDESVQCYISGMAVGND